jgi:protein O-mannosyl-transferase
VRIHPPTKSQPVLACLLLAAATLALYWPVSRCDFISFDDPVYVTENPHVQAGLTWAGITWAFSGLHGEQTYWHPLTWVSHMVDCQLFGSKPAGHHLMNVLLHTLNTILVFLVFRRLTRAFWRSVALAALFGLHPLQVDTVAWVAERKNLLSTFFWLLTTWAYACYAEESQVQSLKSQVPRLKSKVSPASPALHAPRSTRHAAIFYLLSLLLFALGLMCKPVLVTLPFVLLLLDYWPLKRFELSKLSTINSQLSAIRRLLLEKLPFLALAFTSSAITIVGHRSLGVLASAARLPWGLRIENAVVSYVRYLGKTICPSGLAVFYPYASPLPLWEVILCGVLLLVLTGLAISALLRRPYLFVGWFWFLGVLVPFIGLIQGGAQAMADRFAYVPLLGLFLAVVWGASELGVGWRLRPVALTAGAVLAIALCFTLSRDQLRYWQNSETLFRRALQVTEANYLAYDLLGTYYGEHDRKAEAIENLRQSLAIRRRFEPLHNLALAFASQGNYTQAIPLYQEALQLRPNEAAARKNLAFALTQSGQLQEAAAQYRALLQTTPGDLEARNSLGIALTMQGNVEDAIRQFREVLRADSNQVGTHGNLAYALTLQHEYQEAIEHYREVLRSDPKDARARQGLGSALAEQGRLDEAIQQFAEALRLSPDNPALHYNLGQALERQGQREQAAAHYTEALRLKPDYPEARRQLEGLAPTPKP